MSLEYIALIMLAVMIFIIVLGGNVAFTLGGVAVLFGFIFLGGNFVSMITERFYTTMTSFQLEAATLFIFMGVILEASGLAERLYKALYVLMGSLKGGLLIATLIFAILLGACTGVSAATVVAIGLIGLPAMLERGYDKSLVSGTICAGGGLGVVIPPSLVLVLYGPVAGVSIAKLFFAALVPGIILGLGYIGYVSVRCYKNLNLGPPIPVKERTKVSTKELLLLFITSVVPVLCLIGGVLGSIFFGVASPTEAAAVGAILALIICAAYGRLSLENLKRMLWSTLKTVSFVILIVLAAGFFTTIFLGMGGGKIIGQTMLALPLSQMAMIAIMLFINFIFGMFMDWIGVLFILVPIYTPIIAKMGVDPLWFGVLFCITLQISYVTPPFSYSVFFLKGVSPPEVSLNDIYRGVIPYIPIQLGALILFSFFPQLCLYLPNFLMG
jgi:tripartite ATP-independent transporter DctM subunit